VEELHARTLSGDVHPSLLSPWSFEPLQIVPTVVVAALYLRRCRTLAERGQPVPRWKQASFWTGIGLVVFALNSPVDKLGEVDFFFLHMLQHVVIGDLAPLCFVAGLSGPILRPVLALPVVDKLRVLTHPLIALPVWALDLYVWHLPFFYDAALHHDAVHALEHFMFFTCGCLIWEPVIETLPAPAWFGTGMKFGYIAAVRLLETILGNIFIWSSTAFYGVYRHAPEWGITPAHDLNLGGIVMMAEGSIVTLAALVWLFLKMAAEGELRQELIEQGFDPRQVRRAVRYGRAHELQARGG
jgi:cytochrome c oxidase assembly factor CtaG